ncbi:MAG: hypothetical protein WC967_09330 [Balneolaceae bacterium]
MNSFSDVIAGTTATATFELILQNTNDSAGLSTTYELLDADGAVYSQGVGGAVTTVQKNNSLLVQSPISISIPSQIPANDFGTNYQVKVSVFRNGEEITYVYSNIKVLSPQATEDLGPKDTVILQGQKGTLELVLPYNLVEADPDPNNLEIACLIFNGNDLLNIPALPLTKTLVADGYRYATQIDLADSTYSDGGLIPSLDPYTIVWQYITPDGEHNSETASLYGINTTIADATKVVMQKINKARASIKDSRVVFEIPELLNYLRRGRDQFNAFGQVTSFTMTNAKFGQREYWLQFSEVEALRTHYLFEGETDFDFSGQAISLSVQRAQYYDTLADKIEGVLNERVRPYKDLLAKRGNISGDGSADPNRLDKRAIGNVGISITPVSKITSYRYLGVNFLLQRPLF